MDIFHSAVQRQPEAQETLHGRKGMDSTKYQQTLESNVIQSAKKLKDAGFYNKTMMQFKVQYPWTTFRKTN